MITHAGKKDLVDAHTSKTKRSFADIQQKVLHDPVAGGMGHPLQVTGTPRQVYVLLGCCISAHAEA